MLTILDKKKALHAAFNEIDNGTEYRTEDGEILDIDCRDGKYFFTIPDMGVENYSEDDILEIGYSEAGELVIALADPWSGIRTEVCFSGYVYRPFVESLDQYPLEATPPVEIK